MLTDNSTPHASSEYDAQIPKTIPCYDRFHEETMDLVETWIPQPKIWLDTGCGTGSLVLKCLKRFPNTVFFLSDPSEAMLAAARGKLADYSSRTKFLEPSATQFLTLAPEERPDVITAIQAHHYLSAPEREKATRVCHDLLNPGGIFVTFENISPMTKTGIAIGKQRWKKFQMANGKTEKQAEAHLARFGTGYYPITVRDHLELYEKCGFQTVEMLWYSNMQAGFYAVR